MTKNPPNYVMPSMDWLDIHRASSNLLSIVIIYKVFVKLLSAIWLSLLIYAYPKDSLIILKFIFEFMSNYVLSCIFLLLMFDFAGKSWRSGHLHNQAPCRFCSRSTQSLLIWMIISDPYFLTVTFSQMHFSKIGFVITLSDKYWNIQHKTGF